MNYTRLESWEKWQAWQYKICIPQHISALVHVSGEVKVLDHEGDVAIPGLVQAQHPHPRVHAVHREQGPDCSGHRGGLGGHRDTTFVSEMNEGYYDAQVWKGIWNNHGWFGIFTTFIRRCQLISQSFYIKIGAHINPRPYQDFSSLTDTLSSWRLVCLPATSWLHQH